MTNASVRTSACSAAVYRRNRCNLSAALLTAVAAASAANAQWTGNTSNDFNSGSNWTGGATPSLNATWQVNGPGPQGNRTLTVTAPITFSGTAGKIAFGGGSGNITLSGAGITLRSATVDAILSSANGTTTIANNIILSASTGNTTTSLSSGNSSFGGTILAVSGNIGNAAGTGNHTLSMGSTGIGFLGSYVISGNITSANSTNGIIVTKRGSSGSLTLSGTNTLSGLGANEAGGLIRINGGTTNIAAAAEGTSGWGGSNNAANPGVIRISSGALNATTGARALRNSLLIDGGDLNITGGTRLSFDPASNATFTLSSGNVTFSVTSAANLSGVRFGNDSAGPITAGAGYAFTGSQTGGIFIVNGTGTNPSTFSLGSNNATNNWHSTYTLSGGVLDIRGNTGTAGHLTLGGSATGGGSYSTFTLSGTGKLIVRQNTLTTGNGIQGGVSGATQNFDFSGGTLVAGAIDATNLRRTGGSAGTFVNSGGTFAPGDNGEAGLTNVIGNLTINSGTFAVDLGGTSAATAWQSTAAGFYDRINVTGTATLGGLLTLNFIDSFAPTVGNAFTVLTAGSVAGTFSNAASTFTFSADEIDYNFLISYGTNNVVLTLDSISAIPEPSSFVGITGLGMLGFAASRRRRKV